MTTTGTANAVAAGNTSDKEKVEKRRALGRGLESLLPGPRVVAPRTAGTAAELRSAGQPGAAVPTQSTTRAEGPGPHLHGGGAAGEQQVPHSVRNDMGVGEGDVATIQAVVDVATEAEHSAGQPGAAVPTQAVATQSAGVTAEPRSAWTGEAPVPARSPFPAHSPVTHSTSTRGESITIQAQAEGRTPSNLVVNISLDHIDRNPYQTRYLFDEEMLKELAASIQANGLVQPVVVRPTENGRYVLILGERRCRASKIAGKTSIPAIVRRVSDQQAAEMTIIENLQREDLNCMEQAEAFRVLSQEFKLTQQEIGDRVGMSRESVSNYMRLLKLPETVMEYLATNQMSFSDAREIMMLEDPKLVAKAADIAVKKHLSLEKIEDLVMEMQGLVNERPGPGRHGARWVDPNVKAAQSELERLLGVRVRIRDRRGRGKIVIEYATVDDYERVVSALRTKRD